MRLQSPSVEIASAITENGGMASLGDGRTAWYMPDDLRRFRKITTTGKVSMAIAANTFQAMRLHNYPLFGDRHNIVVGAIDNIQLPPSHVGAYDLEHAIEIASENGSDRVFLVGDSKFYQSSIQRVRQLHLTVVQGTYITEEGFPEYREDFVLTHEEPLYTERTGISHIFQQYQRQPAT